ELVPSWHVHDDHDSGIGPVAVRTRDVRIDLVAIGAGEINWTGDDALRSGRVERVPGVGHVETLPARRLQSVGPGGPRLRMLPLRSGLVLLSLRVLRLDGDVAHRRRARRTVPVVLARGDEHDVAFANSALFSVRGDDSRALGDDQDLIRGVLVKLVPRPRCEVDDAEVEAL